MFLILDVSQGRDALTALETFAMEREDTATRLQHEKEELLEELKIARSGQDRSAEEVCVCTCMCVSYSVVILQNHTPVCVCYYSNLLFSVLMCISPSLSFFHIFFVVDFRGRDRAYD